MPRVSKRSFRVRISRDMHARLEREARQRGIPIADIVAQSIAARDVLKHVDPWKAIDDLWEANRGENPEHVEADVRAAVKAVRRRRRRGR